MSTLSKARRLALGAGVVGGSILYYYLNGKTVVHNSWTTNYTPSPASKWNENWDHRSPSFLVNPKVNRLSSDKNGNGTTKNGFNSSSSQATRHIILIRHGQYKMDGVHDKNHSLTELGRRQAEWTGHRLKALALPYTSIIKSTMTRAQETGSIIESHLPKIPVSHCHLIREGAPVPPEPPVGHWKPEAQQFYQDGARIEAGFREYFHRADSSQSDDSYTIVVCHANVIRYFVCRALQFPAEAWLRFSLNHGSITWISITPKGRVILRALGDSGHIPPELISR